MIAKKLMVEKLDSMIGKTFLYRTKQVKVLSYRIYYNLLVIYADKRSILISLDDYKGNFNDFLQVEELEQPNRTPTIVGTSKPDHSHKDRLQHDGLKGSRRTCSQFESQKDRPKLSKIYQQKANKLVDQLTNHDPKYDSLLIQQVILEWSLVIIPDAFKEGVKYGSCRDTWFKRGHASPPPNMDKMIDFFIEKVLGAHYKQSNVRC